MIMIDAFNKCECPHAQKCRPAFNINIPIYTEE